MKIIFCRWGSICETGLNNAMKRIGLQVVYMDRLFESVDYDTKYLQELVELYNQNRDISCIFTVNFQPIIARACKMINIPYVSWTVDCPSFQLYSETIEYKTNRIFLLDRLQWEKFSAYNPDCIFHLPLGCDFNTWDNTNPSAEDIKNYTCDISFVGSLYSEKTRYNQIADKLPAYMKGYADALINAQQLVYGYNFLEDTITDEWAAEFKKYADWFPLGEDYREDIKAIVADTYIGYKCTEQERINTFNAIAKKYNMDLWTLSDTSPLHNINVRGGADSDNMMPQIIKCSKINLNLTNRPIKSGIPLRVFDLMGCGGFVISNYQPEIAELFVPDKDIVLYDSIGDLLNKIGYYLEHDDERIAIAASGREKVKNYHTYDIRLAQMFSLAGLI